MGGKQYGIDEVRLNEYATQIKEIAKMGVQIGIVIGGGNIFRGLSGASKGFDRVKGDQMGMLATVINSLALSSALVAQGVKAKVLTAIRMEPIGEFYNKWRAIELLEQGHVVIMSGGTGNPFFTTDTGSSLRGIEIEADVMLKGTRVDGIYTADPEKDPTATKFSDITYDEIYTRGLKVMDYAIFLLAITFGPNMYVGYVLAVISGMANSFLDTSITPSCMEIFKEKGTIANIFTKLSISIAQFLLPFAIGFVAARNLPFHTIFIATAVIIIVDGIFLCFLPFPPFERVVKSAGQAQGKDALHRPRYHPDLPGLHHLHHLHAVDELQPGAGQAVRLTGSCYDPVLLLRGHRLALFVSAALLSRKVEPAKILIVYPCIAFITLGVIYFVQTPFICLAGGFLLGFFAAGGVLQLVTAVANEMFPKNRGVITSIVMIASSVANYLVISVAGVLTRVGGTNGPRLVLLFNMAVTLVGILLALYLNVCQKRERAAAERAEA